MLHLDENIEEQHPSQEDILSDYITNDINFVQSIQETRKSLNEFRNSLIDWNDANKALAKYVNNVTLR